MENEKNNIGPGIWEYVNASSMVNHKYNYASVEEFEKALKQLSKVEVKEDPVKKRKAPWDK